MTPVNYEEFIRLWMAGKRNKEIAKGVPLSTPSSVHYYKERLKKAGVVLPPRPYVDNSINAKHLNQFIASLQQTTPPTL